MIQPARFFRASSLLLICAALYFGTIAHAATEETWWSLKPISRPAIPSAAPKTQNPIDAFIQAKLAQNNLTPSHEADRRTLIRRLYFDLIGLPPTPQQIEQFVSSPDPLAYERLVDQLLASPRYGERWARYWLDIVHYGDTHGYDKDKPRPNAWPYRDYLIRSFNQDKPYSTFVQEQLAGDVLFPDSPDATEALGFISAGPWDFIGHEEVSESKTDGKIARHLDRDDMVANTMNTFDSMTVQCAQCHNHKFDPISSEDYYSLQAVFAAVDRTPVQYYRDPSLFKEFKALKADRQKVRSKIDGLEIEIAKAGGEALASAKANFEKSSKTDTSKSASVGYHSAIESKSQESIKWVQIDLGAEYPLSRIVIAPCHDDFAGIGDGFGFPLRFRVELANDPAFTNNVHTIADLTKSDFPNPGIVPQIFHFPITSARYLRITATRLAPRQNDFIFALAEAEAYETLSPNRAAGAKVTALDSIEAPPRWTTQNLVDGQSPAHHTEAIEKENHTALATLAAAWNQLPPSLRAEYHSATNQLAALEAKLKAMPPPDLVYVGAVHNGTGNFRGTGPDNGKPRPIFLLNRGDVRKPVKEVAPGALSCVSELPARFELSPNSGEGQRRAALAKWITDPRNPLTWRSIVNRLWQYHFGRALVDTPNDFGRMGNLPSHPELLDWLAAEFRDGGQSFKQFHKLIVTSATYKQTSNLLPQQHEADRQDSQNQWLWRMNRRKLDAEALHDSVLLVSGKLNSQMYGPGYQDFAVERPEHSPHYLYERHSADDPASQRRAIYRFIVRSQPEPFMAALDCADPSMLVAKRNESLSPMQALALLNNDFMLVMAGHFASRVQAASSDPSEQIDFAVRQVFGRAPTAEEKTDLATFARDNGLPNTCRLLFNLNEFMFID